MQLLNVGTVHIGGMQSGMYIMPGLHTHLVQELDVDTVHRMHHSVFSLFMSFSVIRGPGTGELSGLLQLRVFLLTTRLWDPVVHRPENT